MGTLEIFVEESITCLLLCLHWILIHGFSPNLWGRINLRSSSLPPLDSDSWVLSKSWWKNESPARVDGCCSRFTSPLCLHSFVSVLSGFSSVSSVCLSLPQLDSDSSAFLHLLWKNQSPVFFFIASSCMDGCCSRWWLMGLLECLLKNFLNNLNTSAMLRVWSKQLLKESSLSILACWLILDWVVFFLSFFSWSVTFFCPAYCLHSADNFHRYWIVPPGNFLSRPWLVET